MHLQNQKETNQRLLGKMLNRPSKAVRNLHTLVGILQSFCLPGFSIESKLYHQSFEYISDV